MPPIHTPRYRYDDPTLTAPDPGRTLIETVGLVVSAHGVGPKGGGRHVGIPLAIGPLHTRLRRLCDGVEMTLPNSEVLLWNTPFLVAGNSHGCFDLPSRSGWHWLRWTIADHVAHDAAVARGTTPLVIVPCGASKTTSPAPAGQFYRGTYHRLGLKAASKLTGPESIRILSARHGLLPLHQMVEPYNLRLGAPGSITAVELLGQAKEQGLVDQADVILFGGRSYVDLAKRIWPHAKTPLAGTSGIGEQQHRLAAIAASGHLS